MDRLGLYPLIGPCADLVGKGLCQGLRWLLAPWELKQGFQDIVGREWLAEVQPALFQRQSAKLSGFRSSHCACAGNIPVRLAQSHPGGDVFRALRTSCWPSLLGPRRGIFSSIQRSFCLCLGVDGCFDDFGRDEERDRRRIHWSADFRRAVLTMNKSTDC